MGRPTKLTPEMQAAIVAAVVAGNYVETACNSAGVSKVSYYDWVKRGEAGEEPFASFLNAVKKAEGDAEAASVTTVRAMPQNWQANAWWLERRFPKKWGRRDPDHELKTKLLESDLAKAVTEIEVLKAKLKLLEAGQNPDVTAINVHLPEALKREAE